jgi:hypothetical protein
VLAYVVAVLVTRRHALVRELGLHLLRWRLLLLSRCRKTHHRGD